MPQPQLPDISVPDFLSLEKSFVPQEKKEYETKHSEAYEAYCKWLALPEELRVPKTKKEFEKKWKLSYLYTSAFFDRKDDVDAQVMKYFWKWAFSKIPNVVYAIYRRAMRNSSADAKVFVDLIGKKLETDQPRVQLSPLIMIGVPQESIDRLFIPKKYEELADKTVDKFKKETVTAPEAEIVEEVKENPEDKSIFEQI